MSDFSTADDFADYDPVTPGGAGNGVLAPILIGGALAFAALAGQSKIGQWLRGFFSARDLSLRDQRRQRLQAGVSPQRLRELILGQSKAFVASTFGPPRTA